MVQLAIVIVRACSARSASIASICGARGAGAKTETTATASSIVGGIKNVAESTDDTTKPSSRLPARLYRYPRSAVVEMTSSVASRKLLTESIGVSRYSDRQRTSPSPFGQPTSSRGLRVRKCTASRKRHDLRANARGHALGLYKRATPVVAHCQTPTLQCVSNPMWRRERLHCRSLIRS